MISIRSESVDALSSIPAIPRDKYKCEGNSKNKIK
jgi:hypothetical protein